jgi:hypothetical protein
MVPGALSRGVKRPGRETDHSPPSSAEVKRLELYLHSSNTPSWCGAQLKHKDNFTFILLIFTAGFGCEVNDERCCSETVKNNESNGVDSNNPVPVLEDDDL